MRKIILIIFSVLSLLEVGVGIYFFWGYINAGQSGIISLGPTWSKLTSYWLAVALYSLFSGIITILTTYLLLKKKRIGVWLAILSIGLFFTFLLSIKPLVP